jgi:hypothetical protein
VELVPRGKSGKFEEVRVISYPRTGTTSGLQWEIYFQRIPVD